jgi:integrase
VPHLKTWLSLIGDVTLSRVTPDAISRAMATIKATPYTRKTGGTEYQHSPAVVNRYFAALSHCMSKAEDWGLIERNPCERVDKLKEPAGRVRFLSDDERALLLAETEKNPSLRVIILVLLSSGARDMEVRALRWKQVDLVRGQAVIEGTTNGTRRMLFFAGEALDALRAWARVRRIDTDYVFPGITGEKPIFIEQAWRRARRRAGLEDNLRMHDLRHTAATEMVSGGASLPQIGAVLGHKSLQMTMRYAHLTEQSQADVVRAAAQRMIPSKKAN